MLHDSERLLLGACFLRKEWFAEVMGELTAQDFTFAAHPPVFRALKRISEEGGQPDPIRISKILKVDAPDVSLAYVASLTDGVSRETDLTWHVAKLKEETRVRRLKDFCVALTKKITDEDSPLQWAQENFHNIWADEKSETVPIRELIREVEAVAEENKRRGGKVYGIPFGLPPLDNFVGGMPRSATTIIAGRPSSGKSAFAKHAAIAAAQAGFRVMYFSAEDSKLSLGQRMICAKAEINTMSMARGHMTPEEWARFASVASDLKSLPIVINDSVHRIKKLVSLARRSEADLIVVDYLQLLAGDGRESKNIQVGEMSRELKLLAKEKNAAVMVLSQLNRSLEQDLKTPRPPRLSDLRDSGAIEQDADMAILLHRPYQRSDSESTDYSQPVNLDVDVAKNRNGATGVIGSITFTPAFVKFSN